MRLEILLYLSVGIRTSVFWHSLSCIKQRFVIKQVRFGVIVSVPRLLPRNFARPIAIRCAAVRKKNNQRTRPCQAVAKSFRSLLLFYSSTCSPIQPSGDASSNLGYRRCFCYFCRQPMNFHEYPISAVLQYRAYNQIRTQGIFEYIVSPFFQATTGTTNIYSTIRSCHPSTYE